MTPSAEIPVENILHVPCDDRLDDVMNKTTQALKMASQVSSIRTVSIGFDKKRKYFRVCSKMTHAWLFEKSDYHKVASLVLKLKYIQLNKQV